MTFWSRLRSWVKAILRRSRMDSDMDAELRFHIEAFAEDLVSAGVPRSEALRRARRSCNRRQDRSAANHLTLDFGVPTHHHLPPVSRRGHPTVRQQHAPGASPGTSAELSIQSPLGKAGSHGRRNPCRHRRKGEQLSVHVFEDFSDSLFQEDATANLGQQVAPDDRPPQPLPAMRSSKSRFEMLPFARIEKQNLANDLAALGLLLARKNKDRHPSVQDFMLANDSCTVACEVPVYLTAEEIGYYKSKGFFVTLPQSPKPVTGHIDIVQARNGFIHLLDYKPKAREIDPVNQLVVYALAFASRTRLPVKALKCAWFDEKDYFEFFPLQAVKAKSAQASA